MALAYYNEFDPDAADWLENLIAAGLIAPGHVDRRSIKEVQADDLAGYTQHHFFAGIGGWSAAARLAGWPDDRPLWTASCPCQPFSVAGKGAGEDDPRHLWPDLFRLWRAFRPIVGVGEQVAGKVGYDWFNGVRSDLEREAYAARAVDIPACAIDAPHQRNRLYWCAVADCDDPRQLERERRGEGMQPIGGQRDLHGDDRNIPLGDGIGAGLEGHAGHGDTAPGRRFADRSASAPDDCGGTFWSGSDWIICHDGKARRVAESLSCSMDHGFSLFLAHCPYSEFAEARKEILKYAAKEKTRPGEVLRTVRDAILSGASSGQAERLYTEAAVSSQEILLTFLRELTGRNDREWSICSVDQDSRTILRSMRGYEEAECPSYRWQHLKQRSGEHTDALLALSSLLARSCEEAWELFRRTHGPHLGFLTDNHLLRAAAWKGFGNAIVRQEGAEVLAALMASIDAGELAA